MNQNRFRQIARLDQLAPTLSQMETAIVVAAVWRIRPSEASALASIVAAYARTIDITELTLRLGNINRLFENHDGSKIATPTFETRQARLYSAEGTRRERKASCKTIAIPGSASRDCSSCNRLVRSTKNR